MLLLVKLIVVVVVMVRVTSHSRKVVVDLIPQ